MINLLLCPYLFLLARTPLLDLTWAEQCLALFDLKLGDLLPQLLDLLRPLVLGGFAICESLLKIIDLRTLIFNNILQCLKFDRIVNISLLKFFWRRRLLRWRAGEIMRLRKTLLVRDEFVGRVLKSFFTFVALVGGAPNSINFMFKGCYFPAVAFLYWRRLILRLMVVTRRFLCCLLLVKKVRTAHVKQFKRTRHYINWSH